MKITIENHTETLLTLPSLVNILSEYFHTDLRLKFDRSNATTTKIILKDDAEVIL